MNKLSNQKVAQVLVDAGVALRTMASERDSALSKVANMEQRREAENVASQMHDKGINLDQDFTVLTDNLEKAAQSGELGEIRRAVDMVAPDMGLKTASITSDERSAQGLSSFEQCILGDVG